MFLEIKNLEKSYGEGENKFKALNNINLNIERGDICVIMGPSGSGKSTLLNIVGGIDTADNGNVIVDSCDITRLNDNKLTDYRRESVGFVFQFYNLVPNLTVQENIEVVTDISKSPLDIDRVLKAVGLTDKKNSFPKELSGGEQQRVSIARAIVKNPKLLLCDEPTGALDYATSKEILKLIQDVNKEFNTTVLIITHNTALSSMASTIVKIRSGEIIENTRNNNVLPAERIEW